MAHARDIIHALLVAVLFSVDARSQNLFLRSDLQSPEPIMPVEISDALVNRTFKIPTELIARRLHIPKFETLDDLVTLENALRRELADRRVQIPSAPTNAADKDLRIGAPSTLFVRATRQDLAKIDLLLADWMQTVQFQIEITSGEFTPAAAVTILNDVSLDLARFGSRPSSDPSDRRSDLIWAIDQIASGTRFDRPIATASLAEDQKVRLQKTFAEKGAHVQTEQRSAYAGERLELRRPDSSSPYLPITIRPTLDTKTGADTDLTFESRERRFVTRSYQYDVDFTSWPPRPPGAYTITTFIESSFQSMETISPTTSLLVISIATAEPKILPPSRPRTIIFYIITSRPLFSE
jgi:hypothetical protein